MSAKGSLSLSVRADDIPAGGRRFLVEASDAERLSLARELDIPEVRELAADLFVRPLGSGAFSVQGTLAAAVVQTDVVTLEPVSQAVQEAVELTLMAAEQAGSGATQPGGEDSPDLFHGGRIALGALVAEHLALGLDPYPRAPGIAFAAHVEDDSNADASPLAVLAKLKKDGE